jgi:hypothetical protein
VRLIKVLGLAVVAAAAMAAFAGAGTASATVLCKVHPNVVQEEQPEKGIVNVEPEFDST